MSFTSWVDKQISEAAERGAFDNLPGAGKPLPKRSEEDAGQAWLRDYLRREGVAAEELLPTPLRLRKEIERLTETVQDLRSEQEVREVAPRPQPADPRMAPDPGRPAAVPSPPGCGRARPHLAGGAAHPPRTAQPRNSCRGTSASASLAASTSRPPRTISWITSLTSQTLTFMPAMTRPRESQKAMNSRESGSPR